MVTDAQRTIRIAGFLAPRRDSSLLVKQTFLRWRSCKDLDLLNQKCQLAEFLLQSALGVTGFVLPMQSNERAHLSKFDL